MPRPTARDAIVLLGLMATGKTTVGRALADRLGIGFRDSDADIERDTGGVTVAGLAADAGVDAMHRREAAHLLATLALGRPVVVAAAASTVDDPDCVAALGHPGVAVVWLRASVPTMAARFGSAVHRPTFGQEPAALLGEQLARRGPRFARVADLVVDVDGRTPAGVVDEIVSGLGLGGRDDDAGGRGGPGGAAADAGGIVEPAGEPEGEPDGRIGTARRRDRPGGGPSGV